MAKNTGIGYTLDGDRTVVVNPATVERAGRAGGGEEVESCMTFGDYLTSIRGDKSQRQLARLIGVTGQYICDIEKSRRNPPPLPVLERLAAATGAPLDVLCYHAGIIPPDLRGATDAATILAAWGGMRETLEGT